MIRTVLNPLWHVTHAVLVSIVLLPVTLYRLVISPMKRAPSCRFLPTCSEYAVTAVRQRGIVVGGLLALRRLARCNPLFRGGYDPVPCGHRGCARQEQT